MQPLVGVIMGSRSDWETMRHAAQTLDDLGVPYEVRVVSAHRTPDLLFEYAGTAEERGLEVIIAGAGGAAHLPGMTAAKTALPVLGVPVESKALHGIDSLLSIVQMPAGVPVATLAIGRAGAVNAALLAAAILGDKHPQFREAAPPPPRGADASRARPSRPAGGRHDDGRRAGRRAAGRMLALAGYPLGLRFRFLEPADESPAGQLAELRRRPIRGRGLSGSLRRRAGRRHLRVRERAGRGGPAAGASACRSIRRPRPWKSARIASPRRRSSGDWTFRRRPSSPVETRAELEPAR